MDADEATWETLQSFESASFTIMVTAPGMLRMTGELSFRHPVQIVEPYLRKIHGLALGTPRVEVDLSSLSFVNSSGLRVFLDWLSWIMAEPADKRYELVLLTSPSVLWQKAALTPIAMVGTGIVRVVMV